MPDVEIIIEPWQISQQDEDFIYLIFDYGIKTQGEVRIHKSQFLTQDNGNYKLQLKHSDFFLLVDSEHQSKSRFIKASVLVEQLTTDNLRPPTNLLSEKRVHFCFGFPQFFSSKKYSYRRPGGAIFFSYGK
ncbi:hypothetical protein [Lactococcus taiwanensis]|uniref:hypothetical protein n=1 Tax=Lactococcus taiwanensis TaxID=1151742 RepID=UPI003511A1CB